jgi:hypothetical protein
MSESNPFSPPSSSVLPSSRLSPQTISIDPIGLYKRSIALLGDQYWLFVGIALVGMFLGGLVPFGIILGPMLVGIYLCFIDREQGKRVEFGTLFKGFDLFVNSLVAYLIMGGIGLIALIPIAIVTFVALFATAGSGLEIPIFLFCLMLFLVVMMLVHLPFLFVFQLIAERGLTGPQALTLSFQAVKANLVGCIGLVVVIALFSMAASIACYLPNLLLLPVTFGVLFLAYRDVFQ